MMCDSCKLDGPCADSDCEVRAYECDVCTRRYGSAAAARACCDQICDATD